MASATAPASRLFGASVKRREDGRFITGQGQYTDDITFAGTAYAAFVRSPYAHARIRHIDVQPAFEVEGVHVVFTGQDLAAGGVNPIPPGWLLPDMQIAEHRALAVDRVRHVGEAVAVVIADSPYVARDGAERVHVDYEELPGVSAAVAAMEPGAPRLHDNAANNICFRWALGDAERTDAAIRGAAHVVRQRLVNHRVAPVAIEPRASLATYSRATDELTLYVTSQNPHVHRLIMGAFVLGIPEQKFRVISPDVGGGFGSKIFVYPEEIVTSWASRRLNRPVKWTAERRESFMTDSHGRDHVSDVEMAFDPDGRMLALRVHTVANMGAYLTLFAPAIPTYLYGTLLNGVYAIPTISVSVDAVYTNTTPVDAYRGAGRPEACYVLERTMDVAARTLGIDPAELRRRNFIPKDRFPYQTPVALVYDSGNYAPALDRALEIVGYPDFRRRQAEARTRGKYLGLGLSCYIEACGIAPSQVAGSLGAQAGLWESATVRIHPTGKVTVFSGSHSHGQGHETTFAQLAADELGVGLDDVEIVHGDTGRVPFGMGTYGSRSLAVGGSAIHMSIEKIKDKGKKVAAHLLEASPDDMDFRDGTFFVKGVPGRGKTFAEVSLAAYLAHNLPPGMEPGLDATSFYDPSNFTFPFGTHIAVVEVDRETGRVVLARYVAVDDVGKVMNPMIVDGQLHGGIAQGAAQALWEHAAYDDNGQLLAGSLMDYGLPRADMLPMYETDRTETPSPINPLGVKGAGEAGTIASTPAVVNAVMDALSPFGVVHLDMPLTASKVWTAMQSAGGRA